MMKRLLPLALLCLAPLPASANSSTAGFSNEGLKLLKTERIRMASEDLLVSATRIRVRYVFENLTAEPIKTLVAFPFPAVDALAETDVSEASGFQVTLGGTPQKTRKETVYLVRGKRLRDKASYEALLDKELARRDGDEGPTRGFTASTQDLEVWEQVFPPGKGPEVEITYTPSVGGDLGWDKETYRGQTRKSFCIDGGTTKALDKMMSTSGGQGAEQSAHGSRYKTLSYVLMTGNNWAGPIGQFHLTVEKETPDSVLSTCTEGLKKTSPVRFELTRTDFQPDKDLKLIFFL